MGLFIGTNGGDDCVDVNAEAEKVRQVLHGSDASDGCLSFCLVDVVFISLINSRSITYLFL